MLSTELFLKHPELSPLMRPQQQQAGAYASGPRSLLEIPKSHQEEDNYICLPSSWIDHLVLYVYYLSSQNILPNLTLLQMGKMRF